MSWTTARIWTVNETLTAAKMNEISTNLNVLGDDWTSYTPNWTASGTSPAVGNGTLSGSYRTVGKTVDFRILFVTGSSTTYGTGVYNFTLPSAPNIATWSAVGAACFTDTSLSDHYFLGAVYTGGSNVSAFNGSAGRLAQTVPFTFANTDVFSFTGRYTIA